MSSEDARRLVRRLKERKKKSGKSWACLSAELFINQRTLRRWLAGGTIEYMRGAEAALRVGAEITGNARLANLLPGSPFDAAAKVAEKDEQTNRLIHCQAGAMILAKTKVEGLRLEVQTGCAIVSRWISDALVGSVEIRNAGGMLHYRLINPFAFACVEAEGAATALGLEFCSEFLERIAERNGAAKRSRLERNTAKELTGYRI